MTAPVRGGPSWAVIALACTGQYLVVLDVSVVNVALPSIRDALGFRPADLQWVVNGYAVTFAGFLLLGGRAADLYGHRRAFAGSLTLVAAASLVAGLAATPGLLVAARFLQGMGAAVLAPATLTLLITSFPEGRRRVRAIGWWTAMGAAGGATGSLVGGGLTDLLSWRWVFLVNLPICAGTAAAAMLLLRERHHGGNRRIDLAGALSVTAGLTAVEFALVRSPDTGWTSPATLGPALAGLAALAAFLALERRAGDDALLPLRLFRSRSLSIASLAMLLAGAGSFAMWYFVSLYAQNILQLSALQAGLVLVPHSVVLIVAARSASALVDRIGAASVIAAGGLVGSAGFILQWQAGTSGGVLTNVLVPGVLICAGLGLVATPIAAVASAGAGAADAGATSGVITTARQVGGSLALAGLATLASARTDVLLGQGSHPTEALLAGYRSGFLAMAGIALLVAGTAGFLPRRPAAGGRQADDHPPAGDLGRDRAGALADEG